MNKQFVIPELSIELKELGFDEECFGVFINSHFQPRYRTKNSRFNPNQKLDKRNLKYCAAPLWQQAFDWFREKHNLHSYLSPKVKYPDNTVDDNEYYYTIVGDNKDYGDDGVRSYEESKLACLEQLIQIIKKDKK